IRLQRDHRRRRVNRSSDAAEDGRRDGDLLEVRRWNRDLPHTLVEPASRRYAGVYRKQVPVEIQVVDVACDRRGYNGTATDGETRAGAVWGRNRRGVGRGGARGEGEQLLHLVLRVLGRRRGRLSFFFRVLRRNGRGPIGGAHV